MKGSLNDARNYALKLLHYRPRSRKELQERLKRKGFDDKEIKHTLRFLEDTRLIEDRALASGLFCDAAERRHLGRKGIEAFLFRRGIDRELISETLSSHTREMEIEAAKRLIDKKLKILKSYSDDIVRRRLSGMLNRRGFSGDVINTVVKSVKLKGT